MRDHLVRGLAVALTVFVVAEVNYPHLRPIPQLAIFALLGLTICFLRFPVHPRWKDTRLARASDYVFALLTALTCGYVAIQNEPLFQAWWSDGRSLGDRAGAETALDFWVGLVGLVLVLEAARRVVGPALPILSLLFLAYAGFGQSMPAWLFPHRGYDLERIVSQTYLHSQGVYGIALRVMFTYVFLFVVFGAFLEVTGATRFIVDAARRLFGSSAGGPAKVSILSSGLMGSLSGSAVANTATTGTFTIPLMRSAGFRPHVAAGIEAAASSGGALVPPVMGAGAYMMLEIIEPQVTYLQIIQAAILPAILYYFSLFLIAHFSALKLTELEEAAAEAGTAAEPAPAKAAKPPPSKLSGVLFFASLATLVALLLMGFTVFRAVTLAIAVILVLSWLSPATRITASKAVRALERAATGGIALVAAAASVGIVLGVVTLTGVGSKLPATILPLAQDSLFLALLLIMVSSIVLGMGLPSAVCYLLLATLIGPALGGLGVVPLAAHFFIFYFGLMSMVTPPVALAAYTAASIAESNILRSAMAAFRFSLIGFALPFLFVYRPQLLTLSPDGTRAALWEIALAFGVACLAILPLAAAIAGYFGRSGRGRPLGPAARLIFLAAAAGLLYPGDHGFFPNLPISLPNVVGAVVLAAAVIVFRLRGPRMKASAG